MSLSPALEQLYEMCWPYGLDLRPQSRSHLHFLINKKDLYLQLVQLLAKEKFTLVTLAATDEHELEDHGYKIYAVFSHPSEDIFLTLEYPFEKDKVSYPSIYPCFPAAAPFENQIADCFNLFPENEENRIPSGAIIHNPVSRLAPLRRSPASPIHSPFLPSPPGLVLPAGESLLPVGPIHAGVIEPGLFLFRTSGEIIESLDLCLGYTHKGIEHLFQSRYSLADSWKLAERISGDTSCAHSLACCHAVENLAGLQLPGDVALLRLIFLELERIANHIGDIGALAQDVALDLIAGELAVLRENLLQSFQKWSGHRFLRGLNRPGGMVLPAPLNPQEVYQTTESIRQAFLDLAYILADSNSFRERVIQCGTLPAETAQHLGMVGLAARASGLPADFRLQHPTGAYANPQVSTILRATSASLPDLLTLHTFDGDIFCRFLLRVREVQESVHLIQWACQQFKNPVQPPPCPPPASFCFHPLEFALGWAEGWRGPVVYWLMSDKFNRIYRCKVCDPSTFNWSGLKAAVEPHKVNGITVETALLDFPLINKSFNLSYSGYDL